MDHPDQEPEEDVLADYRALEEIAESKGINPEAVRGFMAELKKHLAQRQLDQQDPRRN